MLPDATPDAKDMLQLEELISVSLWLHCSRDDKEADLAMISIDAKGSAYYIS